MKSTRLSVEFLLGLFAEGWTEQQVLENYPQLVREDLQAVFAFSAVQRLCTLGHDVLAIAESASGSTDSAALSLAQAA